MRLGKQTAMAASGSARGIWGAYCAVLLLVTCAPLHASDSLRCGSHLVSVGELAAKVEALCGQPAYRDAEGDPAAMARGYDPDVEVWTYNFGSNRLLQQLRFRNGRLESIRSGGYGFNPDVPQHCGPDDIAVGMTKYELLHACGEPVSKRAESVEVPLDENGPVVRRRDGVYAYRSGYVRDVYREHWVYNFGPNYFLRDVTLENGKVTDVENGERGFDAQR